MRGDTHSPQPCSLRSMHVDEDTGSFLGQWLWGSLNGGLIGICKPPLIIRGTTDPTLLLVNEYGVHNTPTRSQKKGSPPIPLYNVMDRVTSAVGNDMMGASICGFLSSYWQPEAAKFVHVKCPKCLAFRQMSEQPKLIPSRQPWTMHVIMWVQTATCICHQEDMWPGHGDNVLFV